MSVLTVTPPVLKFPKHGRTSLVIKAKCLDSNQWIYSMHSQLPDCFGIVNDPGSGKIVVTYNGLLGTDQISIPDITVIARHGSFQLSQRVQIQVGDLDEFQQIRPNALQCAICVLQFTETGERQPRILSGCGHTLCDSCVNEILDANRQLACPFCRTVTRNVFPPNFSLIQAIEEKNSQNAMTELAVPEHCHDPTVECCENANHEASIFCNTCQKDFCQICFGITHCSRYFKNHDAFPVSHKPPQIPTCVCLKNVASYTCVTKSCTNPEKRVCSSCHGRLHVECGVPDSTLDHMLRHSKLLVDLIIRLKRNQEHFEEKFETINECIFRMKMDSDVHMIRLKRRNKLKEIWNFVKEEEDRLIAKRDEAQKRSLRLKTLIKKMEKVVQRKTELHLAQDLIEEAQEAKTMKIESIQNYKKTYDFNNLPRKIPLAVIVLDDDSEDEIPSRDSSPGPAPPPAQAPTPVRAQSKYTPVGEPSTRTLRPRKREHD